MEVNQSSMDADAIVFDRIRKLLQDYGIAYREIVHEATHTSEASAQARGESLGVGAKALLLKTNDIFRLFVLPADRKIDSNAIKRTLKVRKLRFATPQELKDLTGLVPGAVPPFGEPIVPFEIYADDSVGTVHDAVAFNAGSLTRSLVMPAADWDRVAKPTRFSFAC